MEIGETTVGQANISQRDLKAANSQIGSFCMLEHYGCRVRAYHKWVRFNHPLYPSTTQPMCYKTFSEQVPYGTKEGWRRSAASRENELAGRYL